MKIFAAVAAGAILVALAFLHPAPRPALSVVGPRPVLRQAQDDSGGAQHDTAHARAQSRALRPIPSLVVYVAGEVRNPGLYQMRAGARADDAVRKAGSFTPQADRAAVNLAEMVQDGEEIRVPKTGEKTRPAPRKGRARKKRGAHVSVDLNAAGVAELAQLPGMGETLAARIVAYRAQNGPFASLDELADVSGMTQRRIDAIAQYLILR